jgi:N-acetylneuraminate synthase/N,N'-diacetyllegionaminate synthase
VISIGERPVGAAAPCFVIAEAGVNHNGDLDLALRLVDAAAEAGADAVKFQTFRADAVAAADAPKAAYQEQTTGTRDTQRAMLERLELDVAAHQVLRERCVERGVVFLSTPFDPASAALLDELDVAAFKIASPDLTNYLLLDDVGHRGRPVLLSTGLATLDEVAAAVERLRAAGTSDLVLLHCTSEYPAPAGEANVRAIPAMRERFGVPVGFSDHTEGDEVALAAVALGAAVVEKHLTLDRALPGPDHRASAEPPELRRLVQAIRRVESSLGDGVKVPTPSELPNVDVVRRSIAAGRDLPAGTVLTEQALAALRPATGIPTSRLDEVVGRTLAVDVPRGRRLSWEDFA